MSVLRRKQNYANYGTPVRFAMKQAIKYLKRRRSSTPNANNYPNKKRVTAFANTPHQNPLNAQAKRASKKTKGSKNIRSIVHRKKNIKVSRSLRKKVQKVINGQSFKGTYHATRFGTIGITTSGTSGVGAGQVDEQITMGGYVNQLAFQRHNNDVDGNTRFWFSQALQNAAASGVATVLTSGSEWQFFSPLKIIDAASILWNDKTAAEDYGNQDGNLNTVVVQASGAPLEGTQFNPEVKGLKVHIDNSYVKFKFKNNSQRAMTIIVYNCVPKIKFPTATPLQAFQDAISIEADGSNSAYISATSAGHTSTQTAQALFANPAMQPNMLKSFASTWKYEKVLLKIAPGETCTHSVQGPKSYDLDFSKLYDSGVNQQGLAYKGTTMCVMMAVLPDLAFATGGVVGAVQGVTGYFVPGNSAEDNIADPISICWEEVYRLSIPEIVGFKTGDLAAGRMQHLNKKLPRRAFGNFTQIISADANPTYTAFDEENPSNPIVASQFH